MISRQQAAVATAREFATKLIAPNAEDWERLGRVPSAAFLQAGEAGLCALMVPVELGGQGLDVGGMAAVMQALAATCMSTAFSFVVHNNLCAFIAQHGTSAQRERFLPDMLSGRKIGAFLLTEPHAGSDAQALRTTATAHAGGWIVSGEKAWVSNATSAQVLSVFAQTVPGSGARGIASFLIDADARGVVRTDGYKLMRGHALGAGGFRFEQCRLDADAMVLRPGEAFKGALAGINTARINVASMCCGMLAESLAVAVRYAGAREAFGQPTLDFQGLQWMLADVASDLEAARALTASAVNLAASGADVTLAAAHAKKFATRIAFDGIGNCMQAMGAAGYAANYPLARHLASAKMAQFLDGTSEIQNVVIARYLQSHYGVTPRAEL